MKEHATPVCSVSPPSLCLLVGPHSRSLNLVVCWPWLCGFPPPEMLSENRPWAPTLSYPAHQRLSLGRAPAVLQLLLISWPLSQRWHRGTVTEGRDRGPCVQPQACHVHCVWGQGTTEGFSLVCCFVQIMLEALLYSQETLSLLKI